MNVKDKEQNYRVSLPVFEGPLDLLLNLIEREELDITTISLARVADQYLAYMSTIEEVGPANLAEFLVVAAKLVLIKSQALLPRPKRPAAEGDLDVGEELAEQLRQYRQFKLAAKQLQERLDHGLRTFIRLAPPPKIEPQLDLSDVEISDLLAAVREALQIELPAPSVDRVISRRTITIQEQMGLIRNKLVEHEQVIFQELLAKAGGRVEIAVTLLATLELIKRHEVRVYQERRFGKIVIQPRHDEPAAGL